MEPRGHKLINRYKTVYAITPTAHITEEMILEHWELEQQLTQELLESNPGNRWQVFDKCYSELYSRLEWLNDLVDSGGRGLDTIRLERWFKVIGDPPQKIYEIGSGKAGLISFLARQGFDCRATEITLQRGCNHAGEVPNLTWGSSDGIHLLQFEPVGYYDAVISNQLIEHLHPDDVPEHFEGVRAILCEGGRYLFSVPHRGAGPADVSCVFGCDESRGMHLREYTYGEMYEICRAAGFRQVAAVWSLPVKLENTFGRHLKPVVSRLYLSYSRLLEAGLLLMPPSVLRRKLAKLMRCLFFDPCIFLVARK
jgi:SAM-dependent methyltransferase